MKNILIIIAIVAIVGALAYSVNKNKEPGDSSHGVDTSRFRSDVAEDKDSGEVIDDVIKEEEDGFGGDITENKDDGTIVKIAGEYLDYDSSLLTRADSGDVVLFFHAGWCPTCKALERNLISELADFPDGLSVLKLNYDKESALKKKYGVFIQHTLVQVDSSGNEITKWTGGNDLASVTKRLK